MSDFYYDKAKELVTQMSLEEKVMLCSGESCWELPSVLRLGLESITMMDGPHGLRKQIGATDNLGIGESVPAVCFPTASLLACSFDRELAYEVGKTMGEECAAENVAVILGPGANQKRSPLCGRNFEYFSEDSIHSGEMAAAMINGIQSTGTGASLKHFAVNNQEKRRMSVNALVDERTLHETYLRSFEIAVKKAKPRTVMCAYNRLNGEYCSENSTLLTKILRNKWGYKGTVVSDWGAVHNRMIGIEAGLDLEMPGNKGFNNQKVLRAVKEGRLREVDLDKSVNQVTQLILESMDGKKSGNYDKEVHHQLAIKAATESMVLLQNNCGILPGNRKQKAAVIGAFAKAPRYQGAGSSKINPIQVATPYDSFVNRSMNISFAPGYHLDKKNRNKILIQEACECAKESDIVYLFAGLPEGFESEGFDRKDMKLPAEQNLLIEEITKVNLNVVVILIGGAPVELPWKDKVKGILLAYLGGEGIGEAVVRLLLGESSPCGKLAETWPIKVEDCPCYGNFPGNRQQVEYRESIYVGYKYYEKARIPVNFSFGHGLSYAAFSYEDMRIKNPNLKYKESLHIVFRLTNTGNVAGKETVFVFIRKQQDKIFFPEKELCEYTKVYLEPGETKEVSMILNSERFSYYNTQIADWDAPSGQYEIIVGSSLHECKLKNKINLINEPHLQPDYEMLKDYFTLEKKNNFSKSAFEILYGKEIPKVTERAIRPYTPENTLEDVSHTLVGKIILKYAGYIAAKSTEAETEQKGMMVNTIREMPFFAMAASGEDLLTEKMMYGLLDLLNGHYWKGLKKLI